MHDLAAPGNLKARAQAIRLSFEKLAALTGVAATTVTRIAEKGDGKLSTLQKLDAALTAEELRLRDHLLRLHPVNGGAA